MELLGEVGFWLFGGLLLYAYAGYPALAWLLARREPDPKGGEPQVEGSVTIVVGAHNEEAVIGARLSNIGSLESSGAVDVLVASDGSTDRTNEIVAAWPDPRVRLLALPRGGRAASHNRAMMEATGEFVVFTDAETLFRKDFLTRLLAPFRDGGVGCVVGRLVYRAERQSVGVDTASYWEYETRIRAWESRAGLLSVATGCAMAIRGNLFTALHSDEDGDDAIPLDLLLLGHRIVFAPEATAFDVPPGTARAEIRARARMTVLALTALRWRLPLLNPIRFPRAALSLWSHRVLRCLTPLLVFGTLAANTLLVERPMYLGVFAAQVAWHAVGLLGLLLGERGGRTFWLRLPRSFLVWNLGFAWGLAKALRGQRVTQY